MADTSILRIVLTGGCAAGKSRLLEHLRTRIHPEVAAAFVPESATLHLRRGTASVEADGLAGFQEKILRQQLLLEGDAQTALLARTSAYPRLMLCDRGMPDSCAYLPPAIYPELLSRLGFTPESALLRYQGVLFLDSVATLPELAFCRTDGNAFRMEDSAEEAAVSNERTWEAWSSHPCICRLPAMPAFAQKATAAEEALNRLLAHWYPFAVFTP